MTPQKNAIEERIETSRQALHDTLGEIGDRLSPGSVVSELMDVAGARAKPALSAVGRDLRANPLPLVLALAAVGVFAMWRASERRSQTGPNTSELLDQARARTQRCEHEGAEEFSERMRVAEAEALGLRRGRDEAVDSFQQRVAAATHAMDRRSRHLGQRMQTTMKQAEKVVSAKTQGVRRASQRGMQRAQRLFDSSPLAIGALALAIGAAVGGATPLSAPERRLLDKAAGGGGRA
jgi:predicted outer membrane protein